MLISTCDKRLESSARLLLLFPLSDDTPFSHISSNCPSLAKWYPIPNLRSREYLQLIVSLLWIASLSIFLHNENLRNPFRHIIFFPILHTYRAYYLIFDFDKIIVGKWLLEPHLSLFNRLHRWTCFGIFVLLIQF